jgi:phosphoheptose isomerase
MTAGPADSPPGPARPSQAGRLHVEQLSALLAGFGPEIDRLWRWGGELGSRLAQGHRLLAVGNGGSFAQALHLTGELVGRFETARPPLSAIALGADGASLTAIVNDDGAEQAFARQVRAHGRAGDVLLALSTSGRSPNVVAACRAARDHGLLVWSLTGAPPNPVGLLSHDTVAVAAARTATVQEVHQVAIHVLCAAVDDALAEPPATPVPEPAPVRMVR